MIHNLGFVTNGWKSITLNVLAGKVPSTAGPSFKQFKNDGGSSKGVYTYAFGKTIVESTYLSIVSPSDYTPGTNIYPVLRWSTKDSQANSQVSWGIEATTSFAGADFENTVVISANIKDNGPDIGAFEMNLTRFSSIDGSATRDCDNSMVFRIFRDVGGAEGLTDSFNYDAHLFSFTVFYETDTHAVLPQP